MPGHLIHIGYPKTGSTFLQRWFAQHPQLSFAEGGIAGFTSVYDLCRHSAAFPADVSYRVTSSELLSIPHPFIGGIFDHRRYRSGTLTHSRISACGILASLFPTARILLVTRGFRSIMVSSYSEFVRDGGDLDFRGYLELTLGEDVWNYNHIVELYANAFGYDNLIVLPYELLRDDVGAFLKLVEEQLDLAHFEAQRERINPSLSLEEMFWLPKLSRTVRRLSRSLRLTRALTRLCAEGAILNHIRRPMRLLQRLQHAEPSDIQAMADEAASRCAGKAECLRERPVYTPYARDYLLDG